ncbi:hypothetical protein NADFUDRAFT_52067 [Nadsonia fulvescens var. elongata DSM 6958]|uniref:RmlC-like cupin n=1 Tax=Nadsonia fulvescens var. elongata DSM 6958 TaxID=857566 RepID=A0A1E3PKW1_9ASCO|nr:hypothetical protein NADFUDRAFT_52067 [Nadsonia fulvescens var. elongata DSM 6958]
MTSKFVSRAIASRFVASEQSEGVGARVRRSIGTMKQRNFAPFLMLDHFSVSPGAGFPDHPHRGQETITYMIDGLMDHEDFTGAKGCLESGDLQFMTAGRGIVHAEMPVPRNDGKANVGLQLWVDLAADMKNCEPSYRDLKAKEIPIATPNDKVSVKVISGESFGVKSVQDLAYTPVWMLDYTVQPGQEIEQAFPKNFNVFAYVMDGELEIGGKNIPRYSAVFFDTNGDGVKLNVPSNADKPSKFVLIGGQIMHQPIVQHGPFVCTSREKIMEAFYDYQSHSNGFERAASWESEIGKRM